MKQYLIHNNGGRPFKVVIEESEDSKVSHVSVHQETNQGILPYEEVPFLKYSSKNVFVGKSPLTKMTGFSGAHGPNFDGNSILIQIDPTFYIFVGSEIFSFKTENQIIDYVSPIGCSDVPYPYAIDDVGNCYLMIENVQLCSFLKTKEIDYDNDPYDYYYDHCLITKDEGYVLPKLPKIVDFNNIHKSFMNNKKFIFRYSPDPENEYERLSNRDGNTVCISCEDSKGNKTVYDKQSFINLMKTFGELKGFKILDKKVIYKLCDDYDD